jgi:hypothetical protein
VVPFFCIEFEAGRTVEGGLIPRGRRVLAPPNKKGIAERWFLFFCIEFEAGRTVESVCSLSHFRLSRA